VIVDAHTHIGTWSQRFKGRTSLQSVLEAMAQADIDQAVAMGTDESNNIASVVKENRDKLYHFYFARPDLDGRNPGADLEVFEQEFERGLVAGLKIHPSLIKMRVTDRRLAPYLRFCVEHSMPTLVHCGAWLEMSHFRFPIEVAEQYESPIILAHMGGKYRDLQFQCLDALQGAPENVFLETSSCFVPWIVERAVEILGGDRVVFGSDFPFYHPAVSLKCVELADLSSETKSMVLGRTIRRLCRQ